MRHETGLRIDAVSLVRLAGLSRGACVLAPGGEVPVEALRRLDRVVTRTGPAVVLGVEARGARVALVRIAAEALGIGMPGRDLLVGPATRLWLPRQSRPIEAHRLVDGT